MSYILQVKIFAAGWGKKSNEKDANAFLASMDPSRIVNVMSGVGPFGNADEVVPEPCCVVLYKAEVDELDASVVQCARAKFGGVFGEQE